MYVWVVERRAPVPKGPGFVSRDKQFCLWNLSTLIARVGYWFSLAEADIEWD